MTPTVGRKVWYWKGNREYDRNIVEHGVDPLDATIVAVFGDNVVNLAINDAQGAHHARGSVHMTTELMHYGDDDGRWSWMPYQVEQAAKAAQELPE